MIRPAARSLAVAAALSTALALTACGDDGDDSTDTGTDPVFTEQETAVEQDDTTSASASAAESASESADADDDADDDDNDADDKAVEPSSSGDVEISVTAPDKSSYSNTIIKTGQTTYEMTADYSERDSLTKLPSVGWSPSEELRNCSTKVTYTSEDGTEIAQYRTQDCESSISEGESSDAYEWFDRSPLPAQGQEVDLTIVIEIEADDDTYEGESTISLRNPNNYR